MAPGSAAEARRRATRGGHAAAAPGRPRARRQGTSAAGSGGAGAGSPGGTAGADGGHEARRGAAAPPEPSARPRPDPRPTTRPPRPRSSRSGTVAPGTATRWAPTGRSTLASTPTRASTAPSTSPGPGARSAGRPRRRRDEAGPATAPPEELGTAADATAEPESGALGLVGARPDDHGRRHRRLGRACLDLRLPRPGRGHLDAPGRASPPDPLVRRPAAGGAGPAGPRDPAPPRVADEPAAVRPARPGDAVPGRLPRLARHRRRDRHARLRRDRLFLVQRVVPRRPGSGPARPERRDPRRAATPCRRWRRSPRSRRWGRSPSRSRSGSCSRSAPARAPRRRPTCCAIAVVVAYLAAFAGAAWWLARRRRAPGPAA